MDNPLFWSKYIREVYLPEIQSLREGAVERVLSAFGDDAVDRDAEAAERTTWQRLCEQEGPYRDPGDLAEEALNAGIDRYCVLQSLRQALANLFAVGLHHLVEQQQFLLLRRELLRDDEEDKHALLNIREFIARNCQSGVDVAVLEGWDGLQELRHVANAVKHAEGPAVAFLRQRRPDLFESPMLGEELPQLALGARADVYKPLFGEDIYVRESDLGRYFSAATQFWRSYAGRLEELGRDGHAP